MASAERMGWALSDAHREHAIRCAAQCEGPTPMPPRTPGVLAPEAYQRAVEAGNNDRAVAATRAWLRWREDVDARNRRMLAALLWAADELRSRPDDGLLDELGGPITVALARFGWRAEIPRGPAARRDAVDRWGREGFSPAWKNA